MPGSENWVKVRHSGNQEQYSKKVIWVVFDISHDKLEILME